MTESAFWLAPTDQAGIGLESVSQPPRRLQVCYTADLQRDRRAARKRPVSPNSEEKKHDDVVQDEPVPKVWPCNYSDLAVGHFVVVQCYIAQENDEEDEEDRSNAPTSICVSKVHVFVCFEV